MLPQGITYREKSATRLRELVRKFSLKDLVAFIKRNTTFKGELGSFPAVEGHIKGTFRDLVVPRHATSVAPKIHALAVLNDPSYSRLATNKSVRLAPEQLQAMRLENPSILDREIIGHSAALLKRRMEEPLSWYGARNISLFAGGGPTDVSNNMQLRIDSLKKLLTGKHPRPVPGVKPVKLEYNPDKYFYRGSPFITDTATQRGKIFITPHPDIASRYSILNFSGGPTGPTATGYIRKFPVNKHKFIGADKPGKPVYVPHTGTSDPAELKRLSTNTDIIKGKKDYEGVIEKLKTKGELYIHHRGLTVPGVRRKLLDAERAPIVAQRKQWGL